MWWGWKRFQVYLVRVKRPGLTHEFMAEAMPYGSAMRPMLTQEIIAKAPENLRGNIGEADEFIRGLLNGSNLGHIISGAQALCLPASGTAIQA